MSGGRLIKFLVAFLLHRKTQAALRAAGRAAAQEIARHAIHHLRLKVTKDSLGTFR